MLARSFHVRKNNERVLNARSVRNEQNVPNVRSNYGREPLLFSSVRFIKPLLVQGPDDVNADDRDRKFFFRAAERPLDTHVSFTGRT